MKKQSMLILLASFISISAIAQEVVYPNLSGFRIMKNYPVFAPDNLWDFIDGAADAYLSYGFLDLHVAEYKKGKEIIKLEIYRHTNNTMAFGIYSSERSPSFRFLKLGTQGYIIDGAVNFFKGNYYVKIKTFSKKTKTIEAAGNLALRTSEMLEGQTEMPGMLFLFPVEGKKMNEETFINESVLGHSFLSNAFKADYQAGDTNFSIFVIRNPSSEISRKTVEIYMASTGIDPVDSGEGKYVLSDGYNGKIFLSWKNDLIVIISGLAKDQSEIADKYSSEILK